MKTVWILEEIGNDHVQIVGVHRTWVTANAQKSILQNAPPEYVTMEGVNEGKPIRVHDYAYKLTEYRVQG